MDNITHSLVGALAGIFLARTVRAPRSAVIAVSILANNFPDLDMLYASHLSSPFGYLLHHRGHTHTIAGAVACGAFVWALFSLFALFRGWQLDRGQRSEIAFVALLGSILHLALDWLNTYGVHPFWPISNVWIYGDTLFIIEPTIWITLSLALCTSLKSRVMRIITALPAIAGAVLLPTLAHVTPGLVISFSVLVLALLWSLRQSTGNRRQTIWASVAFLILLLFYFNGKLALASAESNRERMRPPLISFVAPSPGNPFCWTHFEMRTTGDTVQYLREPLQSSLSFFDLECAKYSIDPPFTDPMAVSDQQTRVPLSRFVELSSNCRWRAFLRFARLPSVTECPAGGSCSIDLRFSRAGRHNFSTLPLEGECPENIPPWNPPVGYLR